MTERLPPISFYIPKCYWPETMPSGVDDNWKGFGIGIYAWTLQTYLRLKADGFPCQLVGKLPDEGIVVLHSNALRAHKKNLKPGANLLLVCQKAELGPYAYAQLHVVQNPNEVGTLRQSYYLPHWSQPALIKRDPARGDRFENIAFFGHQINLASELLTPVWHKQLNALGLSWQAVVSRNRWDNYHQINGNWNDYSQIDAVVAVRSFSRQQLYLSQNYISKPATKLYNAWLAEVPAVLGIESAYRAERKSRLDYLEATTPTEVISALKRLRDEPALRQSMVKNGQVRAHAIQPSETTIRWRRFLEEIAVPAYYNWRKTPRWSQKAILGRNYLACKMKRAQYIGRNELSKMLFS